VRAAVLGHPISHSLSPVLHRAAYAALGLADWHYEAIDCDEAALGAVIDGADPGRWGGFSCTMPLKRAALSLATEADPLATAVGAANTLLPLPSGGWRAASTDVVGMIAALGEAKAHFYDVAILGAGGTAQAALAAVAISGAARVTALVRDQSRADQLLATAERLGVRIEIADLYAGAAALTADLVISTLPANAADEIAGRRWRNDQFVLDAVYDPWPTELAAAAAGRGATVISGASMLLHQAAAQVQLMTGRTAPLEVMREALRAAAPDADL
jgi:shikimate dehydrogenase